MKTGQYYFDKLSEVEQKEFMENYNFQDRTNPFNDFLQDEFPSLKLFISYAFSWFRTAQGFDSWQEISDRKVE